MIDAEEYFFYNRTSIFHGMPYGIEVSREGISIGSLGNQD